MASGQTLCERSEGVFLYLCLAPKEVALSRLAEAVSTHYTIEQRFEEGKGEAGLDQYEVRYWHSWHRHITLSMMAHAWLTSIRILGEGKKDTELTELTVPEVRRLLDIALPLPTHSPEFRLACSCWRRKRRLQVQRSHYRARLLGKAPSLLPNVNKRRL